MPEGHTIHRLARDHADHFAGTKVRVSSPQGRFSAAADSLDGSRLVTTDAYGKHLFHHYDAGRTVHIHLGLFGKVFHHPLDATESARKDPPAPRDTVRYRVANRVAAIDLIGATACELLDEGQVEAIVTRLGPDPIRDDADPDRAWAALQRRSVGIGRALMDQSVLAGVGNVYRAEVLFVHGLHPDVASRDVPRDVWEALWSTLVVWLRRGVQERRIITVDPKELGVPRSRIRRADATYVYHQERCRRCRSEIRRYDLAGRWAYACETCQPPPRRSAPPAVGHPVGRSATPEPRPATDRASR